MSKLLLALCSCGLALALGCASEQPEARDARSQRQALIAQPCAGMPATPKPTGSGYPRAFIQVAQVSARALPRPLGSWLAGHAVEAPSVLSFMSESGAQTAVSWQRCVDEACAVSEPWRMIVTPALPASASDPVRLAIELQREQATDQPQSTSLETRDQRPVVLDLGDGAGSSAWSLVVTPYLAFGDQDLRRLAECKARAARRSEP